MLRLMKQKHSYKELSEILNLPIAVISRYASGRILPNYKRALEIINIVKEKELINLIKELISVEEGILIHHKLLSNITLLSKVASFLSSELNKIDKVLTAEVDGISIATLVAKELDSELIVAKAKKEMGIKEFLEVKRIYPSGAYSYLYIPKGALKREEKVLIVDDVIRSGSTVETLYKICLEAGADPKCIFSLLGMKSKVEELNKKLGIPVKVLIQF